MFVRDGTIPEWFLWKTLDDKKDMKLFTRILFFFIGLIILISIVTTYSGITLIEHITLKELEKRLTSDLNLVTFSIDRELYHIEKRLTHISVDDNIKDAIKENRVQIIKAILANISAGGEIDLLQLYDKKGKIIASQKNRFRNYNVVIPDMEKQRLSKGFTLIRMDSGNLVALFASVPIMDDAGFYGNIVGLTVIDNNNPVIRNISDILTKKPGESVIISIFYGGKRVFSTIFPQVNLERESLNQEIQDIVYKEGKSYVGKTKIDNTGYIAAYKPLKYPLGDYRWVYGIAIKEDILLGFKRRLLYIFIAISTLSTITAIIITFFITRGVNPSLNAITDVCREIQAGNMSSRIDQTNIKIKEFNMIASPINKMAESIKEREDTIKGNMQAIEKINADLEEKSNIIRLERKKLLTILETIDDGLVTVNTNGVITYFNKAAEKITGIDRHLAIGRHFKKYFSNLLIEEEAKGTPQELQIDALAGLLYLRFFVSSYVLETNEKGYILLFSDISKQKKIEEFKADFISSITHDIKSYLVPVSGFLNRILNDKYGRIEEPLRSRIASIQENTSKIYQLVENYLNISRIESGRLELTLAPVDISELIRETIGLYSRRVKYINGEKLPLVLIDRSYLERVIVNLITNALKFSDENSEVHIGTKSEGESVVVFVRDKGVGIPEEDIPYIFERYRMGSLGKKEGGIGLGLFIVKSIIGAHGGRIWVESICGKGSTFYFTLPAFKGEI